jgi:hypothetical protein
MAETGLVLARTARGRYLGTDITRNLFELSSWIKKSMTSQADLDTVKVRIANFVIGTRRGRLRLPQHLPPQVLALTKMTKSQLRRVIYQVKPDDADGLSLGKAQSTFVRGIFPHGQVRTVYGCAAVHEWQSRESRTLPETDWPRLGTRSAWPSTPTVTELVAMGRRGLTPLPMRKEGYSLKQKVSLAQFNSDAELCSHIVRRNIVGIRSDIKVPEDYLGHFSYRWGFLILTARQGKLPTGLARFLAGQWLKCPSNLWLQDKVSLKRFLREVPRTDFCTAARVGPW